MNEHRQFDNLLFNSWALLYIFFCVCIGCVNFSGSGKFCGNWQPLTLIGGVRYSAQDINAQTAKHKTTYGFHCPVLRQVFPFAV